MRNKKMLLLVAAAMLLTMACGMFNGVSGLVNGQNSGTAITQMWADVPQMEGMTKANIDLPLPAKLAIQGFVKSSSKGDGSLDFISFTTKSTAQDIYSFYSLDKMTAAGWNLKDQTGCAGDQTTTAGGGFCFFGKESEGNTGSVLSIFVAEDAKTKETTVFFVRVDVKNIPTKEP